MFAISEWVLGSWCLFCFALYFLSASLLTSAALALGRSRAPLCPQLGVRLGLAGVILFSAQALPYWLRCDLPSGCLRSIPPPPPTRLVRGDERPDVVIGLIVDPACGACKDEFAWLQKFLADAPGVRAQLYHFPREQSACGLPGLRLPAPALESQQRAACELSFTIECIGELSGAGHDDTWRALEISFLNLDATLPSAHLRVLAAPFAADEARKQELERCVQARTGPVAARIAAHMRYAVDLDVRGTPTVIVAPFVDGQSDWDRAQVFSGRGEVRLLAAIQRARAWTSQP